MNRTILMLLFVAGLAVIFFACKNDNATTAPTGTGVISGIVTDSSSGAPLAGVTVTAQSASVGTQSQVTPAAGTFSFSFTTDSAKTVTLTFSKSTFRTRTLVAEASSGQVTSLPVALSSSTVIPGGTTSGVASTIFLVSATPTDVSVYGVGGSETSYLIWEVRDSVGLPIDAAHGEMVSFSINGGLHGGEFMYPVSVATNAQGRGTTSLSSGIVSGVVQVVARIDSNARTRHTITSQPVRIVIHSGFADQRHFSVAPLQLNFPALGVVGKRDNISVLVGDIYSNPVANNTAVYFATRAGVIVSSAFTGPTGEGSADLISGNPFPIYANAFTPYGNGYHYVIASTIGQNGTIVRDSILILWSGASQIDSIIPGSINVANAGFQQINFKVSDGFGNTLSSPTSITLTTTGAQAQVAFGLNGSFTLDRDINFPPGALTHFSCIVSDLSPDTSYVSSATLTISVTSVGNGNASATIGGIIR